MSSSFSADEPPPRYASDGVPGYSSVSVSASSLSPMLQDGDVPDSGEESQRVSIASAAPPPYDPSATAATPPSYESIYGRINLERARAGTVAEFVLAVLLLFLGTVGVIALFALTLGVPIAMIVVGAKYWDAHCTTDKLRLYLVVGGTCGVLLHLHAVFAKFYVSRKKRARDAAAAEAETDGGETTADATVGGIVTGATESDGGTANNDGGESGGAAAEAGEGGATRPISKKDEEPCGGLMALVKLFTLAWFICGNVWVYRYDPGEDYAHCDRTLYLFTYWLITSVYIVIGAVVLLFTCLTCCVVCCRPQTCRHEAPAT
eukprot:Opistho-2@96982